MKTKVRKKAVATMPQESTGIREAVGAYIRSLRTKNDMSRMQLAQKMGCHIQTVTYWELGKSMPRPERLKMMSDIFGVDIKTFFAGA